MAGASETKKIFGHAPETAIELSQENPKRQGTASFERYERYKVCSTILEARDAGCSNLDFHNDFNKGYLLIVGEPTAPAAKPEPAAPPLDAAATEPAKAKEKSERMKREEKKEAISEAEPKMDASSKKVGTTTQEVPAGEKRKRGPHTAKDTSRNDPAKGKRLLEHETGSGHEPKKSRRTDAESTVDAGTQSGRKTVASPKAANTVKPVLGKFALGLAAGSAGARLGNSVAAGAPVSKLAQMQRVVDSLKDASLEKVVKFLHGFAKADKGPSSADVQVPLVVNLRDVPLPKLRGLAQLIYEERKATAAQAVPRPTPTASPTTPGPVARPSQAPVPTAAPAGAFSLAGAQARAAVRSSAPPPTAARMHTASPQAALSRLGSSEVGLVAASGGSSASVQPPDQLTGAWRGREFRQDFGQQGPPASIAGGISSFGSGAGMFPREVRPLDVSLPAYLGDSGSWVSGGEPSENLILPRVLVGDTMPPGPCKLGCRCNQVAMRKDDLVKPWIADRNRSALVAQALQAFAEHPGVWRRGLVSNQNRFEPRPFVEPRQMELM